MNQNLKATSYNAIYNDIKEKIDAGILMPGTRIESLRKLSEHYNASDSTIRKSISLLKENNYVYAKERSGIFVREAENNAFTLKFGDTDNFLEQVDAVDILDFC
ncbi:MAG: winged helix-turn-helix domain-containing protein, partial [Eubacterium sp.]